MTIGPPDKRQSEPSPFAVSLSSVLTESTGRQGTGIVRTYENVLHYIWARD